MCGIAGIIQFGTQKYSVQHLKQMTDTLSHRGPDGEGYWATTSGNILLGHRRLSILDLTEVAAQPFHYMDRYVIIHNGEVYNYVELKTELKKKGYEFRSQTDTEVLAAAYDCWKEKCVDRFDGMFAFAIWDDEEKHLFAARDRFGEKPFYYVYDTDANAILFASEMKALWAAGVSRQFNKKMLFNFLTIGYTDNPNQPGETFYENISKLPAANFLRIRTGHDHSINIERYWDIDLENQDHNISDKQALQKFEELFDTSVARRLRSDVPLGTSLSGGVDSSSITATICRHKTSAFKTFSVVFPGFEKNEERYIDQITAHFSLPSFKTVVTDAEIPHLFEKVIQCQEEPFGSAGALPQYKTFELARQHGVKVLLDGQGADETLAGYDKYYKWYWQELFKKRKLKASQELKKAKAIGIKQDFGIRNIISSFFPDFASIFLERQYLLRALRHEDLTKEFVHLQSKEAYYTTPAFFSLNSILYFNTCMHGLEELLRYADRNSMAHGREVRLPFLSHELVELLFSLPSHFKIRDGWTKWILRKSMENALPSEIVWRKEKIGLEPPQRSWMNLSAVREMIHGAKSKLVSERILRPEVLTRAVRPAAAYEKDNFDWRYLVSAQFL